LKKMKIALLEDISYSRCFSEYISHRKNALIDIQIFTSIESIRQYIADNVINILLVGQELVNEISGSSHVEKIIVLTEGNCVGEYTQYPVIFKYQSVEVIIKEVFNIIADDESISECGPKYLRSSKELIGLFSPFGGSSISMFSLQLAKQLIRVKKTLYINLEAFDGHDMRKDGNEYVRGMSEVVFYIRQNKGKLGMKIQSLIQNYDSCDCLFPVDDYRDLYSMTDKDMTRLVNVLSEETDYDTIIFDIGYLGESSLSLMKMCDKLILPKVENGVQRNKQEAFERLLVREGMERTMSNIHCVSMCGYV